MTSLMIARSVAGSLAFASVLAASSANAEAVKMKATLDVAQEVPPNDSKGIGTGQFTFDTETK